MIADEKEIAILKKGGKKLAEIMTELQKAAKAGVETRELDTLAQNLILKAGGKPSFLNYKPDKSSKPYPAALCVSINEEIVHGLPGERLIKEGDVVSLDLGLEYSGLFTDMAITFGIGKIEEKKKRLIETTKEALKNAIKEIRPEMKTGDLGNIIQKFAKSRGYNVAKNLTGHAIGRRPHELPHFPNWGEVGEGKLIKENMAVALEPMLCEGKGEIETLPDGFTIKTKDNSLSAHFEHTILVTPNGGEIITN